MLLLPLQLPICSDTMIEVSTAAIAMHFYLLYATPLDLSPDVNCRLLNCAQNCWSWKITHFLFKFICVCVCFCHSKVKLNLMQQQEDNKRNEDWKTIMLAARNLTHFVHSPAWRSIKFAGSPDRFVARLQLAAQSSSFSFNLCIFILLASSKKCGRREGLVG